MTSPGAGCSARTGRPSEVGVVISQQASAHTYGYPKRVFAPQDSNRYQETLRAPWWMFAFALIGSLALGTAYGSALGVVVGLAVAVLTAMFLAFVLYMSAPRIVVHRNGLRAGPAELPLNAVGEIQVLDAAGMRDALDLRTAPASSFAVVRAWAAPCGIALEVKDEEDPHGVWLLSSRDPQRLAESLQRVRDRMDS